MRLLILVGAVVMGFALAAPAYAQYDSGSSPPLTSPTPGVTVTQTPDDTVTIPPDAKTPAQRSPLIRVLSIAAIVVAGAAGLYIYSLIRKGI